MAEALEARRPLSFAPGFGAQFEGPGALTPTGVAANGAGEVYVAGFFVKAVDVDPSPERAVVLDAPEGASFVAKYSADGALLWVRQFGRAGTEVQGLAVDALGNVVVAGRFEGTVDFDPRKGAAFDLTADGATADVFVLKLDSAGTFVFANKAGTSKTDVVRGVGVDDAGAGPGGSVFLASRLSGTDAIDFDPGRGKAIVVNSDFGWFDAYLVKLV
jgi:streptogramin lyase